MGNKNILVTGSAGFIGMHLVLRLIKEGYNVVGLDNINDYYETSLKYSRLEECGIDKQKIIDETVIKSNRFSNYKFIKVDLLRAERIQILFEEFNFDAVIHLAAQAGVRYSIENPQTYIDNNIVGFFNIIDSARKYKIKNFLYASSSSVYGNSLEVPFNEELSVDKPISLYAATKKSNELIAHVYSNIYNLNTTGLRFFTVYGPWGRPDMAYFSFTNDIINNKEINVYNNGELSRDFTYIDDIINGVVNVFQAKFESEIKYEVLNIGNNKPVSLMEFIDTLEMKIGKKATKNFLQMQKGDVLKTMADISAISKYNYKANTEIHKGLDNFINWYKQYYCIK
jgi:UDP-glucuronate 4-epimerase